MSLFYLFYIFFFFFFQAEDGIRDHCVTGVQTCALPISNPLRRSISCNVDWPTSKPKRRPIGNEQQANNRSEERRVGKSVDLGGRRIIKKKKKKKEIKKKNKDKR